MREENALEKAVRSAVDHAVPVIEAIGAAIVLVGALLALWLYVTWQLGLRDHTFEQIRLTLGRHLALGLEFQLGSDILSTAVSPSFEELGKLGAIATIRTVLNIFLRRELREEAARVEGQGRPG